MEAHNGHVHLKMKLVAANESVLLTAVMEAKEKREISMLGTTIFCKQVCLKMKLKNKESQ